MATEVHGHRGSRGTHPENTIPSFQEALDSGAEYFEFDVHLTKNDIPVVIHDATIPAKKDKLPVRTLTLAEIQKINPAVPSLEQVLQWRATNPKIRLNLEIKYEAPTPDLLPGPDKIADRVISLLKKHHQLPGTIVQSFDFSVVDAVGKIDPKIPLSCLFENPAEFASEATKHKARFASVHYPLLNAENVAACRALGIQILTWTANSEIEWTRLIALGVNGIITDFPRKLRAHLGGTRNSG